LGQRILQNTSNTNIKQEKTEKLYKAGCSALNSSAWKQAAEWLKGDIWAFRRQLLHGTIFEGTPMKITIRGGTQAIRASLDGEIRRNNRNSIL
jgi:hypothetical protein